LLNEPSVESELQEPFVAESFRGTGADRFWPNPIRDRQTISPLHQLEAVWVAENVPTQELRQVLHLAVEVFEDADKAMHWLQERNIQTGNKPPVSTLGSPSGLQNVETVLRQIQYGVIG
jgi:uncharacterized protein (DUF2384 family)